MGRVARNNLQIEYFTGGGARLFGYFLGERVRFRSGDVGKVEARKSALEQTLAKAEEHRPELRMTWLSAAQIRDAEAATEMAKGRRLTDCVMAAAAVLPPVAGILASAALDAWIDSLEKRKRDARTVDKNRLVVAALLARLSKTIKVADITPAQVEDFVYSAVADYTRLSRARALHAWFEFCASPARAWVARNPVFLDIADMTDSAKPVNPPKILTADQSHALLRSSRRIRDGKMMVFTILTTWCLMRVAEAKRTTKDKFHLTGAKPVIIVEARKRGTVSYREVSVPANVLPLLRQAFNAGAVDEGVFYSRSTWETIRRDAGLIKLGRKQRNGRRRHVESEWEENLQRHTGISYLHKKTGNMTETCRQAGTSDDTSFRHYLRLAKPKEMKSFYGPLLPV